MGQQSCGTLFVLALMLGMAPMAMALQPTVETTFPQSIVSIWDDEQGTALVETKAAYYLWSPGTAIKEIATLGGIYVRPASFAGWSPQRILIRKLGTQVITLWRIRPAPPKPFTIPSATWSYMDMFPDSGLFWCHIPQGYHPTDGDLLTPFTLDGERATGWLKREQNQPGNYFVDSQLVDGVPQTVVMRRELDKPEITLWMLDKQLDVTWQATHEIKPYWEFVQFYYCPTAHSIIVAAYDMTADTTFASTLLIFSTENGQLTARISLPPPKGQLLVEENRAPFKGPPLVEGTLLSPDRSKLAFWGGRMIGVFNVATSRIQWYAEQPDGRDLWFANADVTNTGQVAALYGDHTEIGPIGVVYFAANGNKRIAWKSADNETANFVRAGIDRSLYFNADNTKVFFRLNEKMLSLPFAVDEKTQYAID